MSEFTFEYCSLYYLNQWLSYDKGYCEAFESSDDNNKLYALKSAGGFYRVARNLPTRFDVKAGFKRYEPALSVINSIELQELKNDPVQGILKIEKAISNSYGGRSTLSLTTKFLWLKFKQPILIYDSQARNALGSREGDLNEYYEKWYQSFSSHNEQIERACSQLNTLHSYTVNPSIATKEYINDICSNPWFHERVFDIYLWGKGRPS